MYLESLNINKILFFLIGVDILFILIHLTFTVLSLLGVVSSFEVYWRITADGGFAELFQYLKFIIVILVLFKLLISSKKYYFVSWLLLFVVLLLDDSLQFHERFGVFIANALHIKESFGLKSRDIGELIYMSVVGLTFVFLLLLGLKGHPKKFKKISFELSLLFSLLVFFGAFIDVIHSGFSDIGLSGIFGLIEESGEMISLSLIVWYSLLIKGEYKREENSLYNKIFLPIYKIPLFSTL